ncbi:P27 family phage terminase small subunit [Polaribacter haliotis]|uniref:P27 family phage terminase small subunit n=1 Tax=Polaribacter haliotis TaxID=1888915 RepID=A0A7L8AF68_9FLAO|nr:P27 family phage terminase small subunit [Polaribacter haliotis]QOD60632.1 P27 family phage terminase small subunit [Polaribacter haliotis]
MNKDKMKIVHTNSENKKTEKKETEVSSLYGILKELPKPEPGMKLNAAQKKWWYWFGFEFVKTNHFSKVDLMHLQQAAFWMDARSKAIAEVNKSKGISGLVQKFASGATNVTGYVSVIEKADKHLDGVSAHFGLSIKDRSKIKAVEDGSSSNQLSLLDEIEEMLGSKKSAL